MLDRISSPPAPREILERLVADELCRGHGLAIEVHLALRTLRAELSHEVSDHEIVAELLHQAAKRGLALDFDQGGSGV